MVYYNIYEPLLLIALIVNSGRNIDCTPQGNWASADINPFQLSRVPCKMRGNLINNNEFVKHNTRHHHLACNIQQQSNSKLYKNSKISSI